MGDKEKNIVIDQVIGGDSGQALIGCYYTRQGNTYSFYDKEGNEKATDIHVDQDFWFTLPQLPDVKWTLSITNPEGPDKLAGKWNDSTDPAMADGEYQAQAGGAGEEEDSSAASASGYSA